MNDHFNKKIVEKGGPESNVAANELPPEAAKYIKARGGGKQATRPASGNKKVPELRLHTARNTMGHNLSGINSFGINSESETERLGG